MVDNLDLGSPEFSFEHEPRVWFPQASVIEVDTEKPIKIALFTNYNDETRFDLDAKSLVGNSRDVRGVAERVKLGSSLKLINELLTIVPDEKLGQSSVSVNDILALIAGLQDLIEQTAALEVGQVVLGPWTSAPIGFVTLNGSLLYRIDYSNLWAFAQTYGKLVSDATWLAGAYGAFSTGNGSTTFRIPSINDSFVRGVSSEASYTIGTYVADSFAEHAHGVSDPTHAHSVYDPGHAHAFDGGGNKLFLDYTVNGGIMLGSGIPPGGTITPIAVSSATTGISINGAGTGISIQNSGSDTETKPRNIALRACMRY